MSGPGEETQCAVPVSPASALTDSAARAVKWRFAGSLVNAGFQFALAALLARLLAPADFGLVAMAFVVLGLSSLVDDLGMAGAIIQRPKLTERHIRTAFTVSVLLGICLSALVVLAAPLGALAVRNQSLIPIVRALGIGFAVRGCSVVAGALLRRRLDYKPLFLIEFGSYVVGYAGTSVVLVLFGYGVWSLVWGSLAQSLLSSVALLVVSRHSLRPLWGRSEMRELLRFGAGATANGFVNYAAINGDNFIIGRSLGASDLGLYSRAYTLMNLPHTYTASLISGVLFSAFAQVQAEKERLRRGYLIASRVTSLSAAPVMAGMIVAAPHLVRGLYGAAWDGTVLPLQILCAAGYFRALYHLGGSVTQASGRIYLELGAQLGYAAIMLGGCALTAPFGLPAVATAAAGAIVYMYFAMGYLVLRISELTWSEYLHAQLPGVTMGAGVGICALLVRSLLESFGLSSLTIAFALVLTCGMIWGWTLLVVIHSQELRVIGERIPVRLQPLATLPIRVHRRVLTTLSNVAHS